MTARVLGVREAMRNCDNAGCGLLRVPHGCERRATVGATCRGRSHAGYNSLGGWLVGGENMHGSVARVAYPFYILSQKTDG